MFLIKIYFTNKMLIILNYQRATLRRELCGSRHAAGFHATGETVCQHFKYDCPRHSCSLYAFRRYVVHYFHGLTRLSAVLSVSLLYHIPNKHTITFMIIFFVFFRALYKKTSNSESPVTS